MGEGVGLVLYICILVYTSLDIVVQMNMIGGVIVIIVCYLSSLSSQTFKSCEVTYVRKPGDRL